jgi:hypothetical protein
MADIFIDVLNESTEASDQMIIWLTAALQKQVSRDFAPVWGLDATLAFIPKGSTANPKHWQLVFLDNADQAGALGYHDLTATGLPLGKVFIRTTEQAGDAWSVTASHELLEMLGDPYANTSVLMLNQDGVSGTCFAYETCDAVEDDSLGYVINQFKVSDFVYPNWFEPAGTTPAGSKYDFMGHCTGPFQLLKGGYIGAFQIPNTQGWTQLMANGMNDPNAPAGSRRALRQKPHLTRKKSTSKRCGA